MISQPTPLMVWPPTLGPLSAGEERIWVGQPTLDGVFSRHDILLIPWALLSLIWASFWEYDLIRASGIHDPNAGLLGQLAPFIAIPFILFCLYVLGPRLYFRRQARRKTYYAFTSKRILIAENFFGPRLRMLEHSKLKLASGKIRKDGVGDIYFKVKTHGLQRPIIFENIADAKAIMQLLDAARFSS